ncbi:MAG: ATP-binding cassette domain-containing protein [Parabacteroides sp.]
MERNYIVRLEAVEARLPELRFAEPVSWTIEEGQQWAVIGPNGAGKTLLADLMQRKFAIRSGEICYGQPGPVSDHIRSLAFKDIYSMADLKNTYYQQRWHATENEDVPCVSELLGKGPKDARYEELCRMFHMEESLSKKLIYLSSGELRKFLIVRTLLKQPRLLILDNPFIGLDAASRKLLAEMLHEVTHLHQTQVVLLLSDPSDIPSMVTHVLPIYNKVCMPPMSREAFLSDRALIARLFPSEGGQDWHTQPIRLPVREERVPSLHDVTLRMEHVTIRYGERVILQDLDWEVKNGEKWALSGPNGSGKSTLLSLVYADNPQSYANTFYLFDRKRGSGESIWDIKKRIGYVSPEMHLYYQANVPAWQIVGSGYFDSVGLYRQCNQEQELGALAWMRLLGIEELKDRLFMTLSSGEQRLLLLARSFVKDPDLLILDEPLHGLDVHNKKLATRVIEAFCARPGKTLIYVTHYLNELPPCIDKRFELVKRD